MAKQHVSKPAWEGLPVGDAERIVGECARCLEEEADGLSPGIRFRMLAIQRALAARTPSRPFDLEDVFEQVRKIALGGDGVPAGVSAAARRSTQLIKPTSFFNTYISGKQDSPRSRRFNFYTRSASRRLGLDYEAVIACVRHRGQVGYRLRRARRESVSGGPTGPAAGVDGLGAALDRAAGLMAMRGWGDEEVGVAYRSARDLADGLAAGDGAALEPLQFEVAIGMWSHQLVRANLEAAGAEMARLAAAAAAARGEDASTRIVSLRASGTTAFWLGRFDDAERDLRDCLRRLGDGSGYRPFRTDLGAPPLALVGSDLADALWIVGRHREALEMSDRAREMALRSGHPFHDCYSLAFSSWLRFKHGELDRAAEDAANLFARAERYGMHALRALGKTLTGMIAATRVDDPKTGLADMFEGLGEWRASGAELLVCYFYTEAASIWLRAGDRRLAETVLNRAVQFAANTREGYYAAEIARLKGEILWRSDGDPAAARDHLIAALELAESQHAGSFRLRAASSLLRLARDRQDLGGSARARASDSATRTLAAIERSFDGEPESADLRAARDLLGKGWR